MLVTYSRNSIRKALAATDPRRAACGRGKIQKTVVNMFDWGKPMTTGEVVRWVFDSIYWKAEKPNPSHYQRARRALSAFAVRSHRLTTRGRPWVWVIKPEILVEMQRDPAEWWWKYQHPFRAELSKYLHS